MKERKFSVVTIVRNDVGGIEKTLQSVLGQQYGNLEYIVIDGLSTDGTSEIIDNYRPGIQNYVREKDAGIYDAMNKGLRQATGEYVIFMNSGDCFDSPDVLSRLNSAIGNGAPVLVYGTYREMKRGKAGGVIPCRHYSKIWWGPVASHQSTLYNTAFLREHSLIYDTTYRVAADYRLTLEVIKLSSGRVLQTNICISRFDIDGLSCNNQNLGLSEANRVRREVLGWNSLQTASITLLLLAARYTKKCATPLYNLLRK
ncbi:MAG: glycosyltransferase [Muribaculaceae bacterium]|nr:glycosyltransferase [Muribaculaceae bacterium]